MALAESSLPNSSSMNGNSSTIHICKIVDKIIIDILVRSYPPVCIKSSVFFSRTASPEAAMECRTSSDEVHLSENNRTDKMNSAPQA
mmetsp:Transcript_29051/g.42671  ORF Transcript_29051/g.42671 Transcript_29051/m.42671 type:complete len:87 (+) Transcript_29051:681-941(+)